MCSLAGPIASARGQPNTASAGRRLRTID